MTDLSVIIPVYNTEEYLEECLDSVISACLSEKLPKGNVCLQKDDNENSVEHMSTEEIHISSSDSYIKPIIEVIVVNDGSIDRSGEIIESYCKKYDNFKCVNQVNKGLSAARNAGMEVAGGKYIYFLDSDDTVVGEVLRKGYSICEEKNLDLLYLSFENYFNDEKIAQLYPKKNVNNSQVKAGYSDKVCSGVETANRLIANEDYNAFMGMKLIKRELIEANKLRFIEGIIYEDGPFTLELFLNAQRVCILNEIICRRRVRYGSIEHTGKYYPEICVGAYRGLQAMITSANRVLVAYETEQGSMEAEEFLTYEIDRRFRFAERAYRKMSDEGREKALEMLTPDERVLFSAIVLRYNTYIEKQEARVKKLKARSERQVAKIDKLSGKLEKQKSKNQALSTKLTKLKESHSYKLGRMLTSPVRMIRKTGKAATKRHDDRRD